LDDLQDDDEDVKQEQIVNKINLEKKKTLAIKRKQELQDLLNEIDDNSDNDYQDNNFQKRFTSNSSLIPISTK
jgi:hypothetical protein